MLDASAVVSQRTQVQREWDEERRGVDDVHELERRRPRHVDDGPAEHPADAHAQVEQREVETEEELPLVRRHDACDHRLHGREDNPRRDSGERQCQCGPPDVVRPGHEQLPGDLEPDGRDDDATRTDTVDDDTAGADGEQPDDRGQGQQDARHLQAEVAHLVQVGDAERHDEAGADEVEHDADEHELGRERQVAPAHTGCAGVVGARVVVRHAPMVTARTDEPLRTRRSPAVPSTLLAPPDLGACAAVQYSSRRRIRIVA